MGVNLNIWTKIKLHNYKLNYIKKLVDNLPCYMYSTSNFLLYIYSYID